MSDSITVSEVDRILTNYKKSVLDEGRIPLVSVGKVLCSGDSVKNRYTSLSKTKKKKANFFPEQILHMDNDCKLEEMDISHLDKFIKQFEDVIQADSGSVLLNQVLKDKIKELVEERNVFTHEQQNLTMDRVQLENKIEHLKSLYKEIMLELKKQHAVAVVKFISTFDDDIIEMEERMNGLKKIFNESAFSKSAREELNDFLRYNCKIPTAEGLDESSSVSPKELLTEFLMVEINDVKKYHKDWEETDKLQYQKLIDIKINTENYRFIVITGEGGFGKTTLLKGIGTDFSEDQSLIEGLSETELIIYLECRDKDIESFDKLLSVMFAKTKQKFAMNDEQLKEHLMTKRILFLIDGFDEVQEGTRKVTKEILNLKWPEKNVVLSSRPRKLKDIMSLLPAKHNHVIYKLLGILPKDYYDFVKKHLRNMKSMKGADEQQIENVSNQLEKDLKKMRNILGDYLNCPMILTHLVQLKVEDYPEVKDFTIRNSTEIFQSLLEMRIRKIIKRIQIDDVDDVYDVDELKSLLDKFMELHNEEASETYLNNQFEISSSGQEKLEKGGRSIFKDLSDKKIKTILEKILSTLFATSFSSAKQEKKYKFFHLSELEYAFALNLVRHLIMNLKIIMMDSGSNTAPKSSQFPHMIDEMKHNVIWQYLVGMIDDNDLKEKMEELPRYKMVIVFLIGTLERENKQLLEKLSKRLVNIGWWLTDDIGWSTAQYTEGDATVQQITTHENKDDTTQIGNKSQQSGISDVNTRTNDDQNTKGNKEDHEEESKIGKEDMLFRLSRESNVNECFITSAAEKLRHKTSLKLTQGENIGILNHVLKKHFQPKEIVISIDSDSNQYKLSINELILCLVNQKTELTLHLCSQYNGLHEEEAKKVYKKCEEEEGMHGTSDEASDETSDIMMDKNIHLKEIVCKFERKCIIENLPVTLQEMHVFVNKDMLKHLNHKITELRKLNVLGLRIELDNTEVNPESLPKLQYSGKVLNLTLVCRFIGQDPSDGSLVAKIVEKMRPEGGVERLSALWLQDTCLTAPGIENVLRELATHNITVTRKLKIWTKEQLTAEDQDNLYQLSNQLGFPGLKVFHTSSISESPSNEILPKTFKHVNDKASEDLYRAAREGCDAATLDLHLRQGADINWKNPYGGVTALHGASFSNHVQTVRHLIERGADPSIKNDFGETALDAARIRGNQEIVDFLEQL